MVLAPGVFVTPAAFSEVGTLALILRWNPDAPLPPGASAADRFLLSAAHVLAVQWINVDACAASGAALGNAYATQGSQFPFAVDSDLTLLGPVVRQTCLKYGSNTSDAAIAKIALPTSPELLPATVADPVTGDVYRIGAMPADSQAAVNSGAPIVLFGGTSGLLQGALVQFAPTTDLFLGDIQDSFSYSGLVQYTASPGPQPGDSGGLLAVSLGPARDGSGETLVAPIAMHIGVDRNQTPVCYLLDSILGTGWVPAYES